MTPPDRPPAPMPGFDALAERAAAQVRDDRGHPVALTGDALGTAFEDALRTATVVSFDVFDTLLVRRVGHPVDVFLHLDRHPAFARHRFPRPVADLRAEAEHHARARRHRDHGTGEVILPEIYAAFCDLTNLPADAVDALVAAEEEVELLLCRPNPRLRALFQRALGAGKRVLALSDTYLRPAFLARLLEAVGAPLPAGAVFASSEWRVNKQSGALFDAVCTHLRLTPGEVLHIGDHPVSDFQAPRARGVRAVLHGHHGTGAPRAEGPDAPAHSLVRAHAAYAARGGHAPTGFWWHLGHTTFGPLVTGFAQWLRQRFREDRIDRAYFLLRDGEIFHRVFETLYPPAPDVPACRRLAASRRGYVFPLLGAAPTFVRPNLTVCSGPRPVGEFLRRLDVPVEGLAEEFAACGFGSVEVPVDGRIERDRLLALFDRPRVRAALGAAAGAERECLVGYLRQHGVLAGGRVALVDLGWHGTIHKTVQVLATEPGGPELTGYYLAMFPAFRARVPTRVRARAYLGGPDETPRVRAVNAAQHLLEIVCSSTTGSLRRFARSGGDFVPVLQPNPAGPEQLEALTEIHAGIVAFAREHRDVPGPVRGDELPAVVAAAEFLRLATAPTKEEAVRLGGLVHGDDYGTDAVRYAARFRPGSATPEALWDDYEQAYWKPGMLNQPSPQGAALRTLWWLMQP